MHFIDVLCFVYFRGSAVTQMLNFIVLALLHIGHVLIIHHKEDKSNTETQESCSIGTQLQSYLDTISNNIMQRTFSWYILCFTKNAL